MIDQQRSTIWFGRLARLATLILLLGVSAPAVHAGNGALDVLSGLNAALGGGDDELLEADEAYKFTAELKKPGYLSARWQIADGYYMYKKKIRMALEDATGLKLGEPRFPPAEHHDDPNFGSVEIYRGALALDFPILGLSGPPKALTLKAHYQGCADVGVCYPPINKTITFDAAQLAALSHTPTADEAAANTSPSPVAADAAPMVSEQDAIAASLASGNTVLTLLSFFGFGLLLALTPCVFPMIPILSGIIVGQGENVTARRGFMLALTYVLAMAAAYTVVGVLAGLFGANLQVWFQNPWILTLFAIVFVLLALSMFGFYDLQMPASIQSKLTAISNRQEGGKFASAAIMGLLSALIVGPCVTAPLIGALIYIGQTGNAVLGGAALFSLSLGMGAPLLLIGASAGTLLPKAGAWMDSVKAVFGVLLLGVAIWLLERVLPATVTMLLWSLLLIVSGVYMGGLRQIPEDLSKWHQLWKGLGFAILLYGVLMMVGAAAGTGNVMQPLKGLFTGGGSAAPAQSGLVFQRIKGVSGLEAALAQANGRPVMLDFYADWCISCKEMEHQTFTDGTVKTALGNALLLQADVTANDADDRALLKHFGIVGPPAILFFDQNGQENKPYRVVGYMPPERFAAHIRRALGQ